MNNQTDKQEDLNQLLYNLNSKREDLNLFVSSGYFDIKQQGNYWFVGVRGNLKALKSKGYKEYSFIDYSFDLPENHNSRMDLLVKEIVRLNELNLEKYVNMYKDISEHNKKNFFETTKDFDDLFFKIKEDF
jgi:hypothetical protein